MAAKNKNLFLYLAAACFIGIILIFVFDGYMGFYDTLSLVSGEQTQTITTEQWTQSEKNNYPVELWPFSSGNYSFSYQIDNRRFSSYQADIKVSVWKNQEKLTDVLTKSLNIGAFKSGTVDWVIDPLQLIGVVANTDNQFTLDIDHGNMKRSIIIHYSLNNPKTPQPVITQ
jgi:hypothetical protein